MIDTPAQQNEHSFLKEKDRLFYDHIFPSLQDYWLEADQYYPDELELFEKEFRVFIRKQGIKLGDFDKAIGEEMRLFLLSSYLILEGRAPVYIIDHAYGLLLERSYYQYTHELDELLDQLARGATKDELDAFRHVCSFGSHSREFMEGLSIPEISVAASGYLLHLTSHAQSQDVRIVAVLSAPYAPRLDCQPEEWLAYLLGSGSDSALVIIRKILDVYLSKIFNLKHSRRP